MWVGWFPLLILGIGILVFYFHKIGGEIISSEGLGSMYFRWLLEVALFLGISLVSAVILFFFLEDIVTILLVSGGLVIFLIYVLSGYIQIKRYISSHHKSDNYGKVYAQITLYRQFIILVIAIIVTVALIAFICSIYWFSL